MSFLVCNKFVRFDKKNWRCTPMPIAFSINSLDEDSISNLFMLGNSVYGEAYQSMITIPHN